MGSIFTVPATGRFLDILANALIAGRFHPSKTRPDSIAIATTTILLPSRRACRTMSEVFLRNNRTQGAVLPKIRAIGDVDEDRLSFATNLPPAAIPELERRLELTGLVRRWTEVMHKGSGAQKGGIKPLFRPATPAQAAGLADSLIGLMDEIDTEGADMSRLHELVPEEFSQYWQLSLEFLKIITEYWPQHLHEKGMVSAVMRRNMLIDAEIRSLAEKQLGGPIIIAGEAGGIAATTRLLQAIYNLPSGVVILPDLDRLLDEKSWSVIPAHPEHPQYSNYKFLELIKAERGDVSFLPDDELTAEALARLRLISEIMRPAATTYKWSELAGSNIRADTMSNIRLMEANTPQDEAQVIAMIMRRTAESTNETAALVTPDRKLSRRVRAQLERWGIFIDDSGGLPLAATREGVLLNLIIETVSGDFSAVSLMALLKHPLCLMGMKAAEIRHGARILELLVLRGYHTGKGLPEISRMLEQARLRIEAGDERHPALRRLGCEDFTTAWNLLKRLCTVLEPLVEIFTGPKLLAMSVLAETHWKTAENIADIGSKDEASLQLREFFQNLIKHGNTTMIAAREYQHLYSRLIATETARSSITHHPNLFIWGPMEARMQHVDVVILGNLNEGIWPMQADTDVWLNRAMREKIGLSAPERRTGRTASDFSQLLGANKIYLTRAGKINGVPTVASRWLQRLKALAAGAGVDIGSAEPWHRWLEYLNRPVENLPAASRPVPRPPLYARPQKMAVSNIETWIANPYAIYARIILELEPLPELEREPDASLRGILLHAVLQKFSSHYPVTLPDDVTRKLSAMAGNILQRYKGYPQVEAFWSPQFARFAQWFANTEPERRRKLEFQHTELDGNLSIGDFTLTARADRIDALTDGSVVIYDYKTGNVPKPSEVANLVKPQLPLEAAIAKKGGFKELGKVCVSDIRYIEVKGGEPPGSECIYSNIKPASLAGEAIKGLEALVEQYKSEEVGYPALRRASFKYYYDDYAHLARVDEWCADDGE
jgi:ATP-dependent helicase/nuclease subunit B